MNEVLRNLAETYKLASNDLDLSRLYELGLSAWRNQISLFNITKYEGIQTMIRDSFIEGFIEGFLEGFQKGYQEGQSKARFEIVKNMIAINVPLDIIYMSLPLNKLEIDTLIKQAKKLQHQ